MSVTIIKAPPVVAENAPAPRQFSSKMARVKRGHIQYSFEGNGPVIMALHGSPAGCDQSEMLYRDFIDNGFSLLAPSRPGYLGTALEVGRSVAEQAEAFIELADVLGIDKFFIAGYSCGAASAVHLAARYPNRISGMILESPVTKPFEHTSTKGLHGQLLLSNAGSWILQKLITYAPLYSIKRMLDRESTFGQGLNLEARKIFEDDTKRTHALSFLEHCMPAKQRLAGLLNDAQQLANFANDALREVQCPTLIFHGTCDGEVSMSHSEHAAQQIKTARFVPVPNACHLLCVSDRWELVKQMRRDFCSALLRGDTDPFDACRLR
jgi:pimeloyl-ACP methyl ester carboxylesterase